MNLSPLDIMLWQRERLLAGDCLGTVPDTVQVCGEAEQYCSALCASRAAGHLSYGDGVRDGYFTAIRLLDEELGMMLLANEDIAKTSSDASKRQMAKAMQPLLIALKEGLGVAVSERTERPG